MTQGGSPNPLGKAGLDNLGAFLRGLPLEFESIEGTRVVAWMELGPDQHTPWGVVHGGIYTTAVESAASLGASAAVLDRGQFAVGVNNNTDFLRPLVAGRVLVVAEPIQQGATQQLWQVAISRAGDGKLVARGQVRLQNVPLRQGESPS
jgi:1,4-dihydroxy-2-naphthoyl-CoA hydrolase